LFVCPTNKLVQKYGVITKDDIDNAAMLEGILFGCHKGFTFNKFFSIGMNDNMKLSKFDYSGYDIIVFDEIYFNASVYELSRVNKFCDENEDKIIIATGDTDQLKINDDEDDLYTDECLNIIFNNQIFLTQNKRLKTTEDRLKLKQIKDDILINKLHYDEINKIL
jgi:hypothetical protein